MSFLPYLKHEFRFFKKRGYPIYLILFVTERCVNKCKHCLLGSKSPEKNELRLDEYKRISKSMKDLLFLLPTGGEPFLRKDLPEIIHIFYENNHVRNVGIPTSGFDPILIADSVKKIILLCPDIDLAVDVSIDSLKCHDNIRQNPGLFESALKTYDMLQEIKAKHNNFNVNVAITFSRYNQDGCIELYRFLRDIKKVTNVCVLLVRGNPRHKKSLDIDMKKYDCLVSEINKDILSGKMGYSGFMFSDFINAKRILRNNLVPQIYRGKRKLKCFAGDLNAVISAGGNVFPCELKNSFGNLRHNNFNFAKLWFGKRAMDFRKQRKKCSCTHECFLSTNILYNLRLLPSLLFIYIKKKLLNSMGKI